jgi:adenylate kinase family enzyme
MESKKRIRESKDSDVSDPRPLKLKSFKDKLTPGGFIVNIPSYPDYDDYKCVNRFICDYYIKQSSDNPEFNHLTSYRVDPTYEKPSIQYNIPENKVIKITYEESVIECIRYKISKSHATNCSMGFIYEVSMRADNKQILDKMIIHACKALPTSLEIHHYDAEDKGWRKYGSVQKRDESTLIIKKEDKEKLLADVDEFIKSEADYDTHGIPYKRNYLLYGKPGTGKTSLVNVIANRLKRNIKIISFDSDLTDASLYSAIMGIDGMHSILLLEDIDCIFHERGTNLNLCKVSFSALLNVLDGATRSKGLITFITTNYVNKLDKALLRPGRTDMMIKFNIISKEQISGLLDFYKISLKSDIIDELVNLTQSHDLVPATFSSFMFRHRKDKLGNDNYIKLFKKYLQEIDVAIEHNDSGLYS